MRKTDKFQTLNEFIAEESQRDPAFGVAFEKSKARVIKSRLGRPPKKGAKSREMRFQATSALAERIRKAAEKDGRSVSNWLARAAERALKET